MSLTDEQKGAAVDAVAKAVGMAATALGSPLAASTTEAIGALLVDAITQGTLNRLVAHAQATAAVINSEAAAELAARSRT